MLRLWILLVAFPAVAAFLPDDIVAQIPVTVAKDEAKVGELGMSWRFEGPFLPGDGGILLAASPPSVTAIVPCSPAHLAGLEPGDVLLKVNGRPTTAGQLFPDGTPGTRYDMVVQRGDELISVVVTIGPPRKDAPAPVTSSPVGTPEEWGCKPPSQG